MIKLILGVTTELLFRERKKLNELKLRYWILLSHQIEYYIEI